MVAVFVDLDDSRVLDLGDGAGLDVESCDLVGRGVGTGKDHLQGDQAIQPDMPGFVDDAHAAAADLGDDLVARDGRPAIGLDRRPLVGPGVAEPSSLVSPSPNSSISSDPTSVAELPLGDGISTVWFALSEGATFVSATAGPRSPGFMSKVGALDVRPHFGSGCRRVDRDHLVSRAAGGDRDRVARSGVARFAHRAPPLRLFRLGPDGRVGGIR